MINKAVKVAEYIIKKVNLNLQDNESVRYLHNILFLVTKEEELFTEDFQAKMDLFFHLFILKRKEKVIHPFQRVEKFFLILLLNTVNQSQEIFLLKIRTTVLLLLLLGAKCESEMIFHMMRKVMLSFQNI